MQIKAQFIGNNRSTEKLYRLEEEMGEMVKKVATELANVNEAAGTEIDFWSQAIPQTIAQICDIFGHDLELHRTEK